MARARTIEIMRLVGATDWFIRMPFVIEGAVQGAIAGTLAMLVLWLAHHHAVRWVHKLTFYDTREILGFIALCVTLCILGAMSSLRRFLRL
jgi:cell division transport system permease protein